MKQYLIHYRNCKASDDAVKNTHTSAVILLPKWTALESDTKDMVLLREFPAGFSLFVDKTGTPLPPILSPFQLWYDCPTALFKSNQQLLGAHWHQPDKPAVTINVSTTAPNLKMLFHGALAGLSAVILADSGASHTMIDQSYALLHQLKIRPCPYSTANLAKWSLGRFTWSNHSKNRIGKNFSHGNRIGSAHPSAWRASYPRR